MEKIYYFKVSLGEDNGKSVLKIKPVGYGKSLIPYPIDFAELNIPVISNRPSKGDSFDIDYFLDFERGIDQSGESYNVLKKKNLLSVLNKLGAAIDENLRNSLYYDSELNTKITVKIDNGLGVCKTCRFGNPRRASGSKGPKILEGKSILAH